MSVPTWFERLGHEIDRRWLEHDRDEEVFPAIAETALLALPPAEHFDREAFFDAELSPFVPARRERAPLGAFGQPGVTVYFGRDHVIEVYFWVDTPSGVHDHPFRGLFVILEGSSVHARYSFTEDEGTPRGRARTGVLALEGMELLEPGAHRLFSRERHALIHALVHVSVPSISMVIRTARSSDYWRYHPPSLRSTWEPPDEVVQKQIAWLQALREAGDPRAGERLLRFLGSADLETALILLSPLWLGADDATRAALLAPLARHGAAVEKLDAALSRIARAQQADALRAQLRDADERLLVTALRLGERREDVLGLIAARHPDPVARLHAFLDAYGEAVTGDAASLAGARVLVDGGGRAGLLDHLRATFGEATAREQEAQIARFCAESIFAALL